MTTFISILLLTAAVAILAKYDRQVQMLNAALTKAQIQKQKALDKLADLEDEVVPVIRERYAIRVLRSAFKAPPGAPIGVVKRMAEHSLLDAIRKDGVFEVRAVDPGSETGTVFEVEMRIVVGDNV